MDIAEVNSELGSEGLNISASSDDSDDSSSIDVRENFTIAESSNCLINNVQRFSKSGLKLMPFEDLLYKLPKFSKRIPTEPLSQENSYWEIIDKKLGEIDFTEADIDNFIDERLNIILDHFEFLEKGADPPFKNEKPINFNGPFLPSLKQLEQLRDLDITIDWKLHGIQKLSFNIEKKGSGGISDPVRMCKMELKKGCFTKHEDNILLENWIKFQKIYKFYDIRPLIALKTLAVIREGDTVTFKYRHYLTPYQFACFFAFMLRGIPERTLNQCHRRLVHLATDFHDNKIVHVCPEISAQEVVTIKRILERFSGAYVAVELILGQRPRRRYHYIFHRYIKYRNINLHCGLWQRSEEIRFLEGIYEVVKKSNFDDIVNMKKVPHEKVFPYLKTRHTLDMSHHWNLILKQKVHVKDQMQKKIIDAPPKWTYTDLIRLIELVYETGAEAGGHVNWTRISENFPGVCNSGVRNMFSSLYYSRVPIEYRYYYRRGVDYLYHHVRPALKNKWKRTQKLSKKLDFLQDFPLPGEELKILRKYLEEPVDYDEEEERQFLFPSAKSDETRESGSDSVCLEEEEEVENPETVARQPKMNEGRKLHDLLLRSQLNDESFSINDEDKNQSICAESGERRKKKNIVYDRNGSDEEKSSCVSITSSRAHKKKKKKKKKKKEKSHDILAINEEGNIGHDGCIESLRSPEKKRRKCHHTLAINESFEKESIGSGPCKKSIESPIKNKKVKHKLNETFSSDGNDEDDGMNGNASTESLGMDKKKMKILKLNDTASINRTGNYEDSNNLHDIYRKHLKAHKRKKHKK